MLLSQKCYAEGALSLVLLSARLVDERRSAATQEERDAADLLLGLLTPIAKTWSSEWGLVASDIAIQVHGGYGYTRDFDVEQLYRDNRLNPIHEGTTGIQGIDFAGRKLMRDGAAALDLFGARLAETCRASASDARLKPAGDALLAQWAAFRAVAAMLPGADREAVLSNATELMAAFGHIVVAWIWLDQTTVLLGRAGQSDAGLLKAKLAACRFFFDVELPRVTRSLDICRSMSRMIADTPTDIFGP
jgi:hypothetical protein